MAQLVCCLTHILRSLGSSPSHGSLLFAFISMCYYMIYFIYIFLMHPKKGHILFLVVGDFFIFLFFYGHDNS